MDALLKVLQRFGAPPVFSKPVMEMLAEKPLLPAVIFPDRKPLLTDPLANYARALTLRTAATFTRARQDQNGRRMPQAIAHRGYKAKYPENSMRAFRGAVEAGVHALETDVHLSKDGVVVLSHVGSPCGSSCARWYSSST